MSDGWVPWSSPDLACGAVPNTRGCDLSPVLDKLAWEKIRRLDLPLILDDSMIRGDGIVAVCCFVDTFRLVRSCPREDQKMHDRSFRGDAIVSVRAAWVDTLHRYGIVVCRKGGRCVASRVSVCVVNIHRGRACAVDEIVSCQDIIVRQASEPGSC